MKWIAFVVAGLVGLGIVVTRIGSMLPRQHVASRTLTLRRPPQELWPIVTELAAASSVPVDVIEQAPPNRLVTRVKDTEKMFGGTWTIAIAAAGGGSTVTVTEDGWVGQPIFRFMSRLVFGHHATIDTYLKNVAAKFGEVPALSGE